ILKKPIGRLDPWEVSYLSELQCQKLYAFDEEQLRPYFEMKVVLEGIFSIFRRLYGISFCAKKTTISPREGCEDVPVWHESVQYYEVYEKDGRLLGAFYLDLYPRLGKRSGAWVANQLRQGYYRRTNGQWITPIGFVGANLTPPTNEQPSLLTHYEVETLLHEFGHLMHHLMSGVEYASLGGVNVAWDFVELPSQIMENWAWEWDVLSSFAKHYQSGAPLPREIYQKMIHARNHNISIAFMRQLSLQKMDLDLHCSYDGSPLDAFIEKAIDGYVIQYSCKLLSLIRHFTHLFGDTTGYAAAYYSYKWAEVLDADAFTRFQRKGIFNPAVARIFRHRILEQGNREPPQVLFRQFMGRNPCVDALLFRYGLH
ncbi:MAG: M3 family metallopeptidase, partial [Puniceicoccales bacterium]|nr:M3 family metallopeptidase [Puniceicoccales bacterium]